MLEARSVAVVGASVKEGSLGRQMLIELRRGGYDGAIYPVNPGYEEIDGLRAIRPSPTRRAGRPRDPRRREPPHRASAPRRRRRRRPFCPDVLPLYEEPESGEPGLAERLAADRARRRHPPVWRQRHGFPEPRRRARARPGSPRPTISGASRSRSSRTRARCSPPLLFNDRGIGLRPAVSPGQEIVTTMAEYMAYALGRETTRVLALLLETVRDPEVFRRALAEAASREVPVDRAEGRPDRAIESDGDGALGRAGRRARCVRGAVRRVRRARGPDPRRDGRHAGAVLGAAAGAARSRIADVMDSGGERVMFVDLATTSGCRSQPSRSPTRAAMQEVLDPGVLAENPLDAWGTGIDADRIFRESFQLLHDDADTAAVAFAVDLSRQGEPYDESYMRVLARRVRRHRRSRSARCRTCAAPSRTRRPRSCARPASRCWRAPVGPAALRHLLDEGERHGVPQSLRRSPCRTRSVTAGASG